MTTLEIGDTVRLKGGGPLMTIINIVDVAADLIGVQAVCTWFDAHHAEHSGTYHVDALVRSEFPAD